MKKTKSNNDQIPIDFSFITNKHFYNYISGNNKSIIDALSSLDQYVPSRQSKKVSQLLLSSEQLIIKIIINRNIFFIFSLSLNKVSALKHI